MSAWRSDAQSHPVGRRRRAGARAGARPRSSPSASPSTGAAPPSGSTRSPTPRFPTPAVPPSEPTSRSRRTPGPNPVVVMIHEFWGLNPDIVSKADLLAEEGYLVIAPDVFRGSATGYVPTAIYQVVSTPADEVNQDLDAVVEWISSQPEADPTRVGHRRLLLRRTELAALQSAQPDAAGHLGLLRGAGHRPDAPREARRGRCSASSAEPTRRSRSRT